MGGEESTQLQVEEVKQPQDKSPKGRSPPKSNNISPNKSPLGSRKSKQYTTSLLMSSKSVSNVEESLQPRSSEEAESRTKKKIKSVRRLPVGLQRESIEEVEEMTTSGKYDRKAKNEKHEMQKLMRIYDLG